MKKGHKYPLKKLAIIIIGMISISKIHSQGLVGQIDNKLVFIDSITASTSLFTEILNIPSNADLSDFTYHSSNRLFYGINNPADSPSLFKIDEDGNYSEIGPLTSSGNQIQLAEAISYNRKESKIFIAASLNGGVSNNDFFSESIMEVDTTTGACTFISEISTSKSNPDIDVMSFNNELLYIMDGEPPGIDLNTIFQLNFDNVSSTSSPIEIFNDTYLPIRDISATDNFIYFTENRNLRRYNLNTSRIEFIGETHSSSEFNGEIVRGLAIIDCILPEVDLGQDILICEGDTVELDVASYKAEYRWSDGSSLSSLQISTPGEYWVEVQNLCGTVRDTILVSLAQEPLVNLGEDKLVCGTSVTLDAFNPESSYLWSNGSNNSSITIADGGTYWVDVFNDCFSVRDSISLTIQTNPSVYLGDDIEVCDDTNVILDAFYPNSTYRWQNGSTNSTLEVSEGGTFWVRVQNECGFAADTIQIIKNSLDTFIPNVFTPNGDQINDKFTLGQGLIGSQLKVFNRSGVIVYQSDSYDNNWSGKNLTPGVYYYSILGVCDEYKGWVSIIK